MVTLPRSLAFVVPAALSLGVLAAPARALHVADWHPGGGIVVGCLGDSNTADFAPQTIHACGDTSVVNSWCTRLAAAVAPLGWTVRNYGVPGATVVHPNPLGGAFTSTAVTQLAAALGQTPSPDVFVLAFGTNDLSVNGVTVAQVVAAYQSVKTSIEQQGRKAVVALSPTRLCVAQSEVDELAQLNRELLSTFQGADEIVDLANTLSTTSDFADCVHMNNCGQEKRAVAVANQLQHRHDHFTITVRDKVSGVPIPGVKLTTTNAITYVSDATGKVRVYEPGFMGGTVYFAMGECGTSGTCSNDASVSCTTNAQCNGGREPVGTPFFGGCFIGRAVRVYERGTATFDLCPAGTIGANSCTVGTCLPSVSEGPAIVNDPTPLPTDYHRVEIVDSVTGRGIPLVKLTSPNMTHYTDNNGLVAFYDPARVGKATNFSLASDGYTPRSASFTVTLGGSRTITMERTNLAERYYRVTGGGLYRDTVLLNETPPLAAPVLNRQVIGSDSVLSAVYQNRLFWIWGDSGRPAFPLGTFRAPGARSDLPGVGGLDPGVGVNLSYYGNGSGFVGEMCPPAGVPPPPSDPGANLCWMGHLIAVPDADGVERLLATYSVGYGLGNMVKSGWARFNDGLGYFQELMANTGTEKLALGYPYKVRHGATTYAYGTVAGAVLVSQPPAFDLRHVDNPVRALATQSGLTTPAAYEAYTPFAQGSSTVLQYNPDGTLAYSWKVNTRPLGGDNVAVDAQVPSDQKLYGHWKDPDAATVPYFSGGSTEWNAHRGRYVVVSGTALSGEQWLMEADSPLGPWVYTRKVVHHDAYTNYGTRRHPYFDKQNGREIFFEATYTNWLTSTPATPRYNYNQIMYRLDLDGAAVVLPVPVYDLTSNGVPGRFATKKHLRPTTSTPPAAFMAPDRAGYAHTVPVYWNNASCVGNRRLLVGGNPTTDPIFWALPAGFGNPPSMAVALYEYTGSGNARAYAVGDPTPPAIPGYANPNRIAWVWRNPIKVALPTQQYLPALVADAGADACKTEYNPGSGAYIQLSATGSSHATGTITNHQWSWSGGSATGSSPLVLFQVGLTEVTLTTTGNDGATSSDKMLIRVTSCSAGCCDPGCC